MVASVVLNSPTNLLLEQLLQSAGNQVHQTWSGEALTQSFSWWLALDPLSLLIAIELPAKPALTEKYTTGEFVEGLAKGDVVELFVMNAAGRYQEWHVNPDGAWWAMIFEGHRTRAKETVRPQGVVVEVMHGPESWIGALRVPRGELGISLEQDTLVHVSGIQYEGSHRRYFSSSGSQPFTPDFHDARCFERAILVPA